MSAFYQEKYPPLPSPLTAFIKVADQCWQTTTPFHPEQLFPVDQTKQC
jgi:hypothetical protein